MAFKTGLFDATMKASRSNHRDLAVQDALAALLASTRCVRRKLNLVAIAEKLKIARERMGSLKEVAGAIGLSVEMLRQFSRVEKLSPQAKKLVAEGKISGVDVADRISRLPTQDQLPVAQAVIRRELNSDDVRAVVSLRKEIPTADIREIIQRVEQSRNIREYVFEFQFAKGAPSSKTIKKRFTRIAGEGNVRSLTMSKGVGTLIVSPPGVRRMQSEAKRHRITKRALVDMVVAREAD